jgi:hypothetical protein
MQTAQRIAAAAIKMRCFYIMAMGEDVWWPEPRTLRISKPPHFHSSTNTWQDGEVKILNSISARGSDHEGNMKESARVLGRSRKSCSAKRRGEGISATTDL